MQLTLTCRSTTHKQCNTVFALRQWWRERATVSPYIYSILFQTNQPGDSSRSRALFPSICFATAFEGYPSLKNKRPTWCHLLFYFTYAQHVSGINISIIRSLRLFCWITTSVVLFCKDGGFSITVKYDVQWCVLGVTWCVVCSGVCLVWHAL